MRWQPQGTPPYLAVIIAQSSANVMGGLQKGTHATLASGDEGSASAPRMRRSKCHNDIVTHAMFTTSHSNISMFWPRAMSNLHPCQRAPTCLQAAFFSQDDPVQFQIFERLAQPSPKATLRSQDLGLQAAQNTP